MSLRSPEGEPNFVSAELIKDIIVDVDATALVAFGWPYQQGQAENYCKSDVTEGGVDIELSLECIYSKDLNKYLLHSANLKHTETIHQEFEHESLVRLGFSIPPSHIQQVEVYSYDLFIKDHSIKRSLDYGWYNSEQSSWALTPLPSKTHRQIKDFAPSKLDRQFNQSIDDDDIDRIYLVLNSLRKNEL